MDLRYLRHIPIAYSIWFRALLVRNWVQGIPNLPKSNKPLIENFYSVGHLFAVFLAAWLMMPGIPALIGMAPSPPDKPVFGYGADPGPFGEVLEVYPYPLPDNVTAIQGNTEDDIILNLFINSVLQRILELKVCPWQLFFMLSTTLKENLTLTGLNV